MRDCLWIVLFSIIWPLLLTPAAAAKGNRHPRKLEASQCEAASKAAGSWHSKPEGMPCIQGATITVTVLDSSTGEELPARCSVIDTWGYSRRPLTAALYHTAEGGYFYTSGTFDLFIPVGTTLIRIGRGPEYEPIIDSVQVLGDTTLVYSLNGVADMSDLNWYSGDCHVHINHSGGTYTLEPEDAHLLGRAEDINVVNCLDQDYYFTGAPDSSSSTECIVYMSEEYRSGTYGHMGLLGLKQLWFPQWSHWWPMNLHVAEAIHMQAGGLVIPAHPVTTDDFSQIDQWPGTGLALELPVDVARGEVDAFEVMSYSNYLSGGIELEMWYRLLNCGFKLPACAGTDAGVNRAHDRPLGAFRTYVHIPDGEFNFENWAAQLAKGKTFVTNGPLITRFDLKGLMPGDSLSLPEASWRILGWLSVQSAHPIDKAEIITNGEVLHTFIPGGDQRSISTPFALHIDSSMWVAARVTGVDTSWHLVGDTLFAHTSPVYFRIGEARIVKQEDAEFFVEWIEDLESLAEEEGEWPDSSAASRAFNELAWAREYYASLAGIATHVEHHRPAAFTHELLLKQNTPNPFSLGTTIEFSLPFSDASAKLPSSMSQAEVTQTSLAIYDVRGKVVRTLFRGELPPGMHKLYWDGNDNRGKQVASGVYFCRLQSGDHTSSRKMILVR
ncbi:MAG: hypothetical protein GTO29_15310 [Candidatus Latescibacteria bacterium]|nr:hypothetical protein [Candidatus Latescibacterota bacterium]